MTQKKTIQLHIVMFSQCLPFYNPTWLNSNQCLRFKAAVEGLERTDRIKQRDRGMAHTLCVFEVPFHVINLPNFTRLLSYFTMTLIMPNDMLL